MRGAGGQRERVGRRRAPRREEGCRTAVARELRTVYFFVRGLPADPRVWSACVSVDIPPSVAWLPHLRLRWPAIRARPHAFCIAYRRHGASPSIHVYTMVCVAL